MAEPARRISPIRFHFVVSFLLTALVASGVWWLLGQKMAWPYWVASWVVAINFVAFGYYGFDKSRSRSGASRVPELVLHGQALFGGSLGAFLAMHLFRHKTIKGSFRVFFWLIVVLQVALLGWVIYLIQWT